MNALPKYYNDFYWKLMAKGIVSKMAWNAACALFANSHPISKPIQRS